MDPGFGPMAALLVIGVITGVIGYLAIQQNKIKKQIEESRKRERAELAALSGVNPTGLPSDLPPVITPGAAPPGTTSTDVPLIQPGGTPLPPRSPSPPDQSEELGTGETH